MILNSWNFSRDALFKKCTIIWVSFFKLLNFLNLIRRRLGGEKNVTRSTARMRRFAQTGASAFVAVVSVAVQLSKRHIVIMHTPPTSVCEITIRRKISPAGVSRFDGSVFAVT